MLGPDPDMCGAYRAGWQPADRREIYDWASDNVNLPKDGAYGIPGWFDVGYSRHLIDVFKAYRDYDTRQINVEKSVQTGGSLGADIFIQWLFAEAPNPTMMIFHSDDDAKEHWNSRIEKCFENGPHAKLYAQKRKVRQHYRFPHMELWVAGANEGSVQSKSIVNIVGDEIWRWAPKVIDQARNRTEFYKEICKIVFTSQASHEDDAWHDIAMAARRHVWSAPCEDCGKVMPLEVFLRMEDDEREYAGLFYEKKSLPNGDRDYDHAERTAAFKCPHCGHLHKDDPTTKRYFNETGRYVVENPEASPIEKTFRWTSIVGGAFGKIARKYVLALNKRDKGNIEPLQNFYMQQACKYWKDDYAEEEVVLHKSNFRMLDEWEEPHYKILVFDYQEGSGDDTEHLIAVCRCWAKDGTGDSRLYYEGRFDSHQEARKWQIDQRIHSRNVFIDGGDNLYTRILPIANQYGWRVLIGDGNKDSYPHFKRVGAKREAIMLPYSPKKRADPLKGKRGQKRTAVEFRHWSNYVVKSILHRFRRGMGPRWLVASDISPEYLAEMDSERLVTVVEKISKRRRKRWVQKGKRPNHRWDCEAMQIVVALMSKILPMFDPSEDESEKESASPESRPPKPKPRKKPATPPHRQGNQLEMFK